MSKRLLSIRTQKRQCARRCVERCKLHRWSKHCHYCFDFLVPCCAASLRASCAMKIISGGQTGVDRAALDLAIGGPRDSEAPGIYALAKPLIATMLDRSW